MNGKVLEKNKEIKVGGIFRAVLFASWKHEEESGWS